MLSGAVVEHHDSRAVDELFINDVTLSEQRAHAKNSAYVNGAKDRIITINEVGGH